MNIQVRTKNILYFIAHILYLFIVFFKLYSSLALFSIYEGKGTFIYNAKHNYLPNLGNLLIILDKVVVPFNKFDKDSSFAFKEVNKAVGRFSLIPYPRIP